MELKNMGFLPRVVKINGKAQRVFRVGKLKTPQND
jgi:hypothetical protein